MTTWCRQGLRRARPHIGVHPYGRSGVRHNAIAWIRAGLEPDIIAALQAGAARWLA
jgi:hypothetical protein